jgi:hypothetical protein
LFNADNCGPLICVASAGVLPRQTERTVTVTDRPSLSPSASLSPILLDKRLLTTDMERLWLEVKNAARIGAVNYPLSSVAGKKTVEACAWPGAAFRIAGEVCRACGKDKLRRINEK